MGFEIFIVGLNHIGASLGMALAKPELEMRRVGFDPDSPQARRAHKAGAVDHLVSHPEKASQGADITILSLPLVHMRDYMEVLGKNLKADSVVIDTAPLKVPPITWAGELFPEDRYYIGATPIVGPKALLAEVSEPEAPCADLFHGCLMAIVVPPKTPEKAVTAALRLVATLGAIPFFLDPVEHDAVIATVAGLPSFIGAALMQVAAQAHNWREIQRMAGPAFAAATNSDSLQFPEMEGVALFLNQEIILHKIDALISEMHRLRSLITAEDNVALIDYLREVAAARDAWLSVRQHGDWASHEIQPIKPVERPGFLSYLFGNRPSRSKDRK